MGHMVEITEHQFQRVHTGGQLKRDLCLPAAEMLVGVIDRQRIGYMRPPEPLIA